MTPGRIQSEFPVYGVVDQWPNINTLRCNCNSAELGECFLFNGLLTRLGCMDDCSAMHEYWTIGPLHRQKIQDMPD